MKLTPVTGPGAIQDLSTPEHVRTAKMMQAYNKALEPAAPVAQEFPVANANNISAEELSAIKPKLQAQAAEVTEENTEVEATEVKDPELEKRFQQIARQERALRAKIHQENQRLKAEREALKTREAELEAKYRTNSIDPNEYISKSRLKEDALTVLEEVGTDWDQLTQQAVSRQPTDPRVLSQMQKMQAKIDSLEASNKANLQTQEQKEAAQYQAAIKQIKADAKQLVYTDPEFELVKNMNAVGDVVELIERTFKEEGTVLSVEEAAKQVEDYLLEEATKITQIDKIKKRIAASKASGMKSDEKTQSNRQPQQMKTLTNATSSTRKLSATERAVARANGFKGDF